MRIPVYNSPSFYGNSNGLTGGERSRWNLPRIFQKIRRIFNNLTSIIKGRYLAIDIPGSSKCVKFVPVHHKTLPKNQNFTDLKDPSIQDGWTLLVITPINGLKGGWKRDYFQVFECFSQTAVVMIATGPIFFCVEHRGVGVVGVWSLQSGPQADYKWSYGTPRNGLKKHGQLRLFHPYMWSSGALL